MSPDGVGEATQPDVSASRRRPYEERGRDNATDRGGREQHDQRAASTKIT